MKYPFLLVLVFIYSCKTTQQSSIYAWKAYDETEELAKNADHESIRMQYKLIQSKILDKNKNWVILKSQLGEFTESDYENLKPYIYDQDIPSLQDYVQSGKLTYESLTKWYLFRIHKYENDRNTMLNAIIAINPNAVNQAREKDKNRSQGDHPIFGIPILLKDNINTKDMPTTAGAHAFLNNKTEDAFITERIKEKGGIILGKTNLSEWANYLCLSCPNGYSAVGGQTLNAYGRKIFDTGGSSSGSAVAMSAHYAAASVGTETSGSILSPSSKSSLVGLKPTVGLLSRGGIVPISSTLDTPGPMTRNMTDNAILLSAMTGEDPKDLATKDNPKNINYLEAAKSGTLKGIRFGVNKSFLQDSLYKITVEKIVSKGGVAIEFEPIKIEFENFGSFLSADMKIDLPNYIKNYGSKELPYQSVADIVDYNKQDTSLRIPYGQGRFEGILEINMSSEELTQLKTKLNQEAKNYFETPMTEFQLDVILSINNRNAGFAAAANYPCLTMPMGYSDNGEPSGITFIARPFEEEKLLKIGFAFEQAFKIRVNPQGY